MNSRREPRAKDGDHSLKQRVVSVAEKEGYDTGIFKTWAECEAQGKGYPNNQQQVGNRDGGKGHPWPVKLLTND